MGTLVCAKHHSKYFTCINAFNSHKHSKVDTTVIPFYRWDTEAKKVDDLPNISQLTSSSKAPESTLFSTASNKLYRVICSVTIFTIFNLSSITIRT